MYLTQLEETLDKTCGATKPEHFLTIDSIEEVLKNSISFKIQRIFEMKRTTVVKKKDFVNSVAGLDIVDMC